MMMMMVMMMMIAFKSAVWVFCFVLFCLQSPHCTADYLQHARSSGQGAIVCKLVRRDSSAIKLNRVEIAFILALFYWLKPLTDVGGDETGAPGENPGQRASENATY